MGAVAEEVPGESGEAQGTGEDGHFVGASELSRDTWRAVFARLAAGDPSALAALYEAAARQVFGLALWRTGSVEDASDVVQEVFLRVAQRHRRLAKVRDPKSWLLGVAHHVAIDVTRRRKRRAAESLDVPKERQKNDKDRRSTRRIPAAPPAQRDVIYLRHFADCTFAVIGNITGVPTFTAASRYRLGIERLRRLMGGME
jgi:RNA polymerase sigma-70 factor (ECF subfamily)